MCVRREKVVELVIERCDGLGGNQAELGRNVVPPESSVVPTVAPIIIRIILTSLS